jgi:hypothetical protein
MNMEGMDCSRQVEDLCEGPGYGGMIGVGVHEVFIVVPPFQHERMGRQLVQLCGVVDMEAGEKVAGLFVQKDGVLLDPGQFEQIRQVGPKSVMSFFVFGFAAGMEFHFERDPMHVSLFLSMIVEFCCRSQIPIADCRQGRT